MIPLISIVIVTRNRIKALNRLKNSIKNSSATNFETIIIDNSLNNRGNAVARNIGAYKAKGKYVLFIDDDNIVGKKMIKQLAKNLNIYPHLAAVGPLTYYFEKKNTFWFLSAQRNLSTSMTIFETVVKPEAIIEKHLYPSSILHNCFMIRKKLGNKVGWFDEKLFMVGFEFDLFERIKKVLPSSTFATDLEAICYHDTPLLSINNLRSLGFSSEKRVYYFQRNRGVYTGRYGTILDKIVLSLIFYPIFFSIYTLLFMMKLRFDYLWAHWKGTIVGEYYLWQPSKIINDKSQIHN